jgi:hypothetical protein
MIRKLLPAAVLLAAVGLVGCSPEEKLYHVSGTITYQGKAVPKGIVHFDPEGSGPQGFANIENGKFDTAAAGQGKGIRGGGKYTIRINGFDGKVGPEAPLGTALFPEYTETRDLKSENQTLDIDVKKKKG